MLISSEVPTGVFATFSSICWWSDGRVRRLHLNFGVHRSRLHQQSRRQHPARRFAIDAPSHLAVQRYLQRASSERFCSRGASLLASHPYLPFSSRAVRVHSNVGWQRDAAASEDVLSARPACAFDGSSSSPCSTVAHVNIDYILISQHQSTDRTTHERSPRRGDAVQSRRPNHPPRKRSCTPPSRSRLASRASRAVARGDEQGRCPDDLARAKGVYQHDVPLRGVPCEGVRGAGGRVRRHREP